MADTFFETIKRELKEKRESISCKIDSVFSAKEFDEDFFEEIEEVLIISDFGIYATLKISGKLKENIRRKNLNLSREVREELEQIIADMIKCESEKIKEIEQTKHAIIIVGVNGVGKTTTIGKLANIIKNEGKEVVIGAGDTFRAAAVQQLNTWAERADVRIISNDQGADPASVIFDSVKSSKARQADVLICDTAGRLHNKANLMNELSKIYRVVEKEYEKNIIVYIVIDAVTGQNGLIQARKFTEAINIDGIILTKMDGTAKGGIVVSIVSELGIPVRYIGFGEGINDLQRFNPEKFVEAIFEK